MSSENRESSEWDRNELMFLQAEKREDAECPPFGSADHYGVVKEMLRLQGPAPLGCIMFCIIGEALPAAIHRFSRKEPGVFPDAFISADEIARLALRG